MSLLALNSGCSGTYSSSDPSMLTRSSSRAGSAHSIPSPPSKPVVPLVYGATWGALLDSGVVLGALPAAWAVLGASLDSRAEPCGVEFGAANMSSPKPSPSRLSYSQSLSSSPSTFCSSTLAPTSTSCSSTFT